MSALTLRQRLEFRAARTISLLSPRMQVRLSGKAPVTIDGQTLEPEIQLMLSLLERRGRPPYGELTLRGARAEMRRGSVLAAGRAPAMATVSELEVAGADGPLRARRYVPPGAGSPQPLIVFLHGGGFVLGDLDSHDVPCRLLARHAGAQVLSVDYRLAPEHPFPAAVEDADAAVRWAIDHAESLGADPRRIAVAGDSAGGNLAAVASWQLRPSTLALQILIYPATEFIHRAPSHELFDQGFLLIREDMDWFSEQYRAGADPSDPRMSIIRAGDLSGVPPALIVTAGFDPLRDEGEAYAERLRQAGVPVVLRRFPGLIHGFMNMVGLSLNSRDALVEVAGAARAMLADPRIPAPTAGGELLTQAGAP